MDDTEWITLDTETTGFSAPILVVEIAAPKKTGLGASPHG
jgi:DNA polymerase III epsilon subunit-like protein